MGRIDMEIADILKFIRQELVRLKHSNRGLLKNLSEITEVGPDVLSKFQAYESDADPSFRTTYKILRGLLNRPPINFADPFLDYSPIPLVSEQIAANPEGIITGDAIDSLLYLPHSLLHGRNRLVAVRLAANANSMEPTLRPGDLIVIDLDDRDHQPQGLFAVRLPDQESCTVKRIQPLPDKKHVLLISDNRNYAPLPLEWRDDLIIGRIIFSQSFWS